MRVYNNPMTVGALNLVMNTTIDGPAMPLNMLKGYSIQIVWTGTPTGTFTLQASSDPAAPLSPQGPSPYKPTNWSTIDNTSVAVSSAGSEMWNIPDVQYNWVRYVYTDGSGGTSTAVITSAVIQTKEW